MPRFWGAGGLTPSWSEPGPVQRRWQAHLSGRRNYAPELWSVLMFQAWLESNRAQDRDADASAA